MALRVPEQQAAGWVGAAHGRRVALPPARSKYRAVAVTVDGFRFASKAEAWRYQQLLIRGLAGELRNLELQPRFDLHVNGVRVGSYFGDFGYDELVPDVALGCGRVWERRIEDVKSEPTKTAVYRLKKRMVSAEYGITISEV